MASKTQAKAAIDAADVSSKADIDNILPTGVNIKSGSIGFTPMTYAIILDAGGNGATATSWMSSIETAMTAASRPFTETRSDRRSTDGPKTIVVSENSGLLTVIITNF